MFNAGEHCVPTFNRYSCHPQQLLATTPEALLQTYKAQRKHPVFPSLLLALSVSRSLPVSFLLSLSFSLYLSLSRPRCVQVHNSGDSNHSMWWFLARLRVRRASVECIAIKASYPLLNMINASDPQRWGGIWCGLIQQGEYAAIRSYMRRVEVWQLLIVNTNN